MGNLRFQIAHYEIAQRLCEERGCQDYRDPAQLTGYRGAWDEATKSLCDAGIFDSQDLPRAMFTYLNLSIDSALSSENPIIRAFAMLDRRLGRRRFSGFNSTKEHPLVIQFYRFRGHVEGLRIGQPLPATAVKGAKRPKSLAK